MNQGCSVRCLKPLSLLHMLLQELHDGQLVLHSAQSWPDLLQTQQSSVNIDIYIYGAYD